MLKNLARFESIIEGKVGHFLLDHDTPIAIAKEMCVQFLKYIGQVEDAARAQQEATKAEADKAEVPVLDEAKAA